MDQNGAITSSTSTGRDDLDGLRGLLGALGTSIREQVCLHRDGAGVGALGRVAGLVAADVIYEIDRVSEHVVVEWFAAHWPDGHPVRIVMEGVDDDVVLTYPAGTAPDAVRWICIIDPIDGTRNLMFDKRAAWVLAALAPAGGDGPAGARLADIELAVMTELPTTKQGWADQVSARRGGGPGGVDAQRIDLRSGVSQPFRLSPSQTTDVEHGFCSFAHALPDGKTLLAEIEAEVWDRLVPRRGRGRSVFEDQYLCSGGQLYEVASGRDRFVGDLRPLVAGRSGVGTVLSAHPYDVCAALVLSESGGVFEDPWGGPVDVPLDTTSPVAFMAYANPELAAIVRPAVAAALESVLGIAAH